MDWSNESYVRLYTRDTTTWRRLGWDGQCVLVQLIRKVDRAGVLEIGDLAPWEAAMLHIGCPEDVAKRGMEALVRTETVTIHDGRVTFPSFIEAQECVKSDKLRARESRARRAAEGAGPQSITKRDDMQSQTVTPASREITTRHAPSRAVTPRHSLLCSALPSSALPEEIAREAPPPELNYPEPPNSSKPSNSSRTEPTAAANAEWDAVLGTVCAERKRAKPVVTPSQSWQIAGRVRDLAATHGVSFREAARKLAEAGLAAPKGKVAWTWLEVDPYAEPERDVRNMGFVPAAKSGTYGTPTSVEALWGPPKPPAASGGGE